VRILISNDDGFDAQGIKTLVQTLSQEHEIVVVAPNENKSASSSALTLDRALQPIEIKKVHLVLHRILGELIQKNKGSILPRTFTT
jgi:5'/3'-nucleotidase SurE